MPRTLSSLSPDEAQSILTAYAQRAFGAHVETSRPFFHHEDEVWEGWVLGLGDHVKAYILRPGPEAGSWACRHVQVPAGHPGP